MGLDFDVAEFCKKLRQDRPPPYQCPLEKCDRVYKSLYGLQYHLVNYDHDNPTPITPTVAASRKKGRSRAPVPTGDIALQSPPKEALTFAEAQKVVQFEIDGKISRISIDQPLPMMTIEEWEKKNAELEKPLVYVEPPPEPQVSLPEARYTVIPDYNICDAPPRPNAYIRFIEKSAEELDGEVEYDVDEEDTAWLSLLNRQRAKQGLPPVPAHTLELLMDRLEKESYFQAAQSGQNASASVDEDAVCCICLDGECQNTNVILFCDMCNLAVHQDCYGVPYIPEGQWLCRRCLQSPSRLVDCVLCPNTGGAFKQTDQGLWAHVVCALWIPEVRFANTVFLEPIDSIERIPPARWKLACLVCKRRGAGACIQCHRPSCYAAFHVTCAQQAGLFMKMEAGSGRGSGDSAQPVQVAKIAYCDTHTPPQALQNRGENEDGSQSFAQRIQARQQGREKVKQARRALAARRATTPGLAVCVPSATSVAELASRAGPGGAAARAHLLRRLLPYWTLKRHQRNGAPLLRRLQGMHLHHGGGRGTIADGSVNTRELCNQLKYWQRIRQDLERARLLCELVRKRERRKAELTRASERLLLARLRPDAAALRPLLAALQARDQGRVFTHPVDLTEVPDYITVVTQPMDFSTMEKKLDDGLYQSIEDMERDFHLMINNCLAYNNKDTVFYKAAVKMRDQCATLFRQARADMAEAGLIAADTSILNALDTTKSNSTLDVDADADTAPSEPETKSVVSRGRGRPRRGSGVPRGRGRSLSRAAVRVQQSNKHKMSKAEAAYEFTSESESQTSSRTRESEPPTRLSSPRNVTLVGKVPATTSPSGVNRRTAVLFTRKAQQALRSNPAPAVLNTFSPEAKPSSTPTTSPLAKSTLSGAESVPKKKGRGRPRKSKDTSTDKFSADGANKSGSEAVGGKSEPVPASFLVYRGPRGEAGSDSDDGGSRSSSSSSASSCSSCTHYDEMSDASCSSHSDAWSYNETLESSTNQTMSDAEGATRGTSSGRESPTAPIKARPGRPSSKSPAKKRKDGTHGQMASSDLAPLQLVWAKCRGYPWYPALIIDPKMPRGYVYNGVPLPAPPPDVLNLKRSYPRDPPLHLVLFFDAKRTWQWLPAGKLARLGAGLDEARLGASRKPTERKAVRRAYADAMSYRNQVGRSS